MKPKENFGIAEPAKCTRMSEEETEYDGGFWNFVASAGLAAVSFGCDALVGTGIVRGKGARALRAVSGSCNVASVALSFGVEAGLMAGSKTVARFVGRAASKSIENQACRWSVSLGANSVHSSLSLGTNASGGRNPLLNAVGFITASI